ncbi:MAG: hypothetical protein L0Z62_36545 [Gemmataceae bacterium]|nr:hypothetical protein [Gemmataceae bacterium]
MTQPVRRTIHYTQVPDLPPDSPIYREWLTFRRELPRLLAEGHEGKWTLVKGEALAGLYPTRDEAVLAGYEKFGLEQFMIQQILTEAPLLLLPWYFRPCHT